MKILITSVGRRSYLVKYFKDVIGKNGEVHVSNNIDITPAFKFADKYVVTPLIYDKEYIPFLKEYCKVNNINAIISLFDIDLPILSKSKSDFNEIGVKVIVSDYNILEICNDKWETYKFLIKNNIKTPKTYLTYNDAINALDNNEIDYPLIIKPRWGMGSISIFEAENQEELNVLYRKAKNKILETYLKYESNNDIDNSIIIQEKIQGQEYGLDIINDLNGEYVNTIIRKKYAMRSGETDCAEIVENNDITSISKKLSKKLKHIANLDTDIFIKDDEIYVLEMNARFGGGYPFSHIAGVNLPKAIINWINNELVDVKDLSAEIGTVAHKDIEIIKI